MEFVVTTRQQLSDIINEAVSKAMTHRNEVPEKKTEIIDREELCKRLNITVQTVIRYEKKKAIPRLEIGTSIRYDWHKVLESLEGKKRRE